MEQTKDFILCGGWGVGGLEGMREGLRCGGRWGGGCCLADPEHGGLILVAQMLTTSCCPLPALSLKRLAGVNPAASLKKCEVNSAPPPPPLLFTSPLLIPSLPPFSPPSLYDVLCWPSVLRRRALIWAPHFVCACVYLYVGPPSLSGSRQLRLSARSQRQPLPEGVALI